MNFSRKVDQSAYSNPMPEYPSRVLTVHCAVKGLQLGSVVGALVVPPLVVYRQKVPFIVGWRTGTLFGPLGGVALSLGMLYVKDFQGALDVAGVDDRAYRIANNAGQVKMDMYSLVGAAAGATTGVLLGSGGLMAGVSGAVGGVALSVGYYMLEKTGVKDQLLAAVKSARSEK